jgi:ankyrin repeat protein
MANKMEIEYEPYLEAPELMDTILDGTDVRQLLLLNNIVNMNMQNASGQTPLFMAGGAWNTDLIDRFLANGADPNIVDHQGNNPLHACCARYEDRETGNITAYGIRNYRSAIRSLVDSNLNINHKNNAGQTPLFLSSAGNDLPAVELLLQLNADPTIADNNGVLPSKITTNSNIRELLEQYEFPVKGAVEE